MFLQVNNETVAKDKGGVNIINRSGIFDLNIKAASVKSTPNGATNVDFNFEGKDGACTVYRLPITKNDGSENFGMPVLQSLCTTLGLEGLNEPEMTEMKFGDKTVELNVLTDLTDQNVKVQIKRVHERGTGEHEGKIFSKLVIKRFYRAIDGATGSEIVNDVTPAQMGKDAVYADQDQYKDGITPEEVEAKDKAEAEARKSGNGSTPAANPMAPKPEGAASNSPFNKKG